MALRPAHRRPEGGLVVSPFVQRASRARQKTRRLPEPSAHDGDPPALAYRLMDAAATRGGGAVVGFTVGDEIMAWTRSSAAQG
jgi:hypothetical protein